MWKTAQASIAQLDTPELKKIIKDEKQANMVLPFFPKAGLGNNYPLLNVYDVVPQIRKINKTNQLTVLFACNF